MPRQRPEENRLYLLDEDEGGTLALHLGAGFGDYAFACRPFKPEGSDGLAIRVVSIPESSLFVEGNRVRDGSGQYTAIFAYSKDNPEINRNRRERLGILPYSELVCILVREGVLRGEQAEEAMAAA